MDNQECNREIAEAIAQHIRLQNVTARCLLNGEMDALTAHAQAAADMDHLNDTVAEIRHRYGAVQP